jgi:hypothetical protein
LSVSSHGFGGGSGGSVRGGGAVSLALPNRHNLPLTPQHRVTETTGADWRHTHLPSLEHTQPEPYSSMAQLVSGVHVALVLKSSSLRHRSGHGGGSRGSKQSTREHSSVVAGVVSATPKRHFMQAHLSHSALGQNDIDSCTLQVNWPLTHWHCVPKLSA